MGGHTLASSLMIATWIKTTLTKAGINTSILKTHPVRGASTTAVTMAGVSTPEVLDADDWSSKSVSERFFTNLKPRPLV